MEEKEWLCLWEEEKGGWTIRERQSGNTWTQRERKHYQQQQHAERMDMNEKREIVCMCKCMADQWPPDRPTGRLLISPFVLLPKNSHLWHKQVCLPDRLNWAACPPGPADADDGLIRQKCVTVSAVIVAAGRTWQLCSHAFAGNPKSSCSKSKQTNSSAGDDETKLPCVWIHSLFQNGKCDTNHLFSSPSPSVFSHLPVASLLLLYHVSCRSHSVTAPSALLDSLRIRLQVWERVFELSGNPVQESACKAIL
jgi:hypothetical protein